VCDFLIKDKFFIIDKIKGLRETCIGSGKDRNGVERGSGELD